jgi:hypothetical protein
MTTSKDRSFVLSDGFFLRAIHQAFHNPHQQHFILLDELNRCNVPQVLGDTLTTLEASKRAIFKDGSWDLTSATVTTLPLSKRQLVVPENLHIIGTMNTTDRSVAPLDSALRRRFAFVRLEPMICGDREDKFPLLIQHHPTVITSFDKLNEDLLKHLGPDAKIGHSYLFELEKRVSALLNPEANRTTFDIQNLSNAYIEEFWEYSVLPQVVDHLDSISVTAKDVGDKSEGLNHYTYDYRGRGIFLKSPDIEHNRRFSRTIIKSPVYDSIESGMTFSMNRARTNSNKLPKEIFNSNDEGLENAFSDDDKKVLFIHDRLADVSIDTGDDSAFIFGYKAIESPPESELRSPRSFRNIENDTSVIFEENPADGTLCFPEGGRPLVFAPQSHSCLQIRAEPRPGSVKYIQFNCFLFEIPNEPLKTKIIKILAINDGFPGENLWVIADDIITQNSLDDDSPDEDLTAAVNDYDPTADQN